MADPRADTKFDDIKPAFVTFKIDNSTITYDSTETRGCASTMRDKAVSLSAAETVQLISDGEAVVGKLIEVFSDNYCTVQVRGFLTLPGGLAASLTLGKKIVGATGAAAAKGYIREVATATAAELGLMRGMIIDAGTTTAVVVRFE
jgi:hypothetical protein